MEWYLDLLRDFHGGLNFTVVRGRMETTFPSGGDTTAPDPSNVSGQKCQGSVLSFLIASCYY